MTIRVCTRASVALLGGGLAFLGLLAASPARAQTALTVNVYPSTPTIDIVGSAPAVTFPADTFSETIVAYINNMTNVQILNQTFSVTPGTHAVSFNLFANQTLPAGFYQVTVQVLANSDGPSTVVAQGNGFVTVPHH
jgi:hypothetical protein